MKKRGRKKKNEQPYFGELQEEAILRYMNTDCAEEKNKIYMEYLAEPFRIMRESILRSYPTHIGNHLIEDVEHNALTHLVEQMVKYNPESPTKSGRPTKAYSYCGTIVRNFYRHHSKNSYSEKIVNVSFDDYFNENEDDEKHSYTLEYDVEVEDNMQVLIKKIIEKITDRLDNKESNLSEIEIVVGEAVITVLENWNSLFIEDFGDDKHFKATSNKFTKNKILLYLRELTGLSTKDIRLGMKGFREMYFLEKDDFYS
jgi:hypothetical protein